MKKIGLAGMMGSGKSSVRGLLAQKGAAIIDADDIGHRLLEPLTDEYAKIVEIHGSQICNKNGTIDRRELGRIVFSDRERLKELNGIMHPPMKIIIQEELRRMEGSGVNVAVLEAAVLPEAGWQDMVDETWLVLCNTEKIVRRLLNEKKLTEGEIRQRIKFQDSDPTERYHFEKVIENGGTTQDLAVEIRRVWKERVEGISSIERRLG